MIASASARESFSGTRTPLTPGRTSSGRPPTSVATSGRPGRHRLERDVGQAVDVALVLDRRHRDQVGGREVGRDLVRAPQSREAHGQSATPSSRACARARPCSAPSPTSTRRSCGSSSSARACAATRSSKPFTRRRRPMPATTTSVGGEPEPIAQRSRGTRQRGQGVGVGAVRDPLEPSAAAEGAARSSSSSLGATTAALRSSDQRVTRPTAAERSDTATSEPCRLTTSGTRAVGRRALRSARSAQPSARARRRSPRRPAVDRAERTADANDDRRERVERRLDLAAAPSDSEKPHGVQERRGE